MDDEYISARGNVLTIRSSLGPLPLCLVCIDLPVYPLPTSISRTECVFLFVRFFIWGLRCWLLRLYEEHIVERRCMIFLYERASLTKIALVVGSLVVSTRCDA